MTLLPAEQQHIGKALDLPAYDLPAQCMNPFCDAAMTDRHHVVRRSHVGRGQDAWWVELYGRPWPNCVGLCRDCHSRLTINKTSLRAIRGEGMYVWREGGVSEFLDPHPSTVTEGEEGDRGVPQASISSFPEANSPSVTVRPGEKCPTCDRRVGHPKSQQSPVTKTVSFRVPLDDWESVNRAWEDRADRMGLLGEKYYKKHTLDVCWALADAVDDETLRNVVKEVTGK
jgi:hypothetical protein